VLAYRHGGVELDEDQEEANEKCRKMGYIDWKLEEKCVYHPNIESIMDYIMQERLLTYAEAFFGPWGSNEQQHVMYI
jgi:hypothetical protein